MTPPAAARTRAELPILLGFFALSLLGLALRLDRIGARSLWMDELSAYTKAAASPAEFVDLIPVDFNMVLYYVVSNIYFHLYPGPFDEAAFRLPSAVVGAATIPLVVALGRRCHSAWAGLVGGLVLAINVFHVGYSQEGRSYAAFAFATAATWLLFLRYLDRPTGRRAAAFVVATVANLYLHYYAALNAALQLAMMLWLLRGRPEVRRWVLMTLSIAVLSVPIGVVYTVYEGLDPGRHLGWLKPLTLETLLDLLRQTFGVAWAVVLLYTLALAACLAYAWRCQKPGAKATRLVLVGHLAPIVFLCLVGLAKPYVSPRYMTFLVPGLATLIGVGVASLPRRQQLLGLVLLVGASVAPLREGAGSLVLIQSGWRGALASTMGEARPGDGWIFQLEAGYKAIDFYAPLGIAPSVPMRDRYTIRGLTVGSPRIRRIDTESGPGLRGRGLPTEHETIWLVVAQDYDNWARVVHEWLAEAGYEAEARTFGDIQIFRYRRLTSSATLLPDGSNRLPIAAV